MATPMLPSPRIFRSRWTALIWAGGIVWAALDYAGSAPSTAPRAAAGNTAQAASGPVIEDAMGDPANADDLKAIANLIGE